MNISAEGLVATPWNILPSASSASPPALEPVTTAFCLPCMGTITGGQMSQCMEELVVEIPFNSSFTMKQSFLWQVEYVKSCLHVALRDPGIVR